MYKISMLALFAVGACTVQAPGSPNLPGGQRADTGISPGADAGVQPSDAGPADAGAEGCVDDGFEPNNDMNAATPLSTLGDAELTACPGDEDWARFEIEQGQRIKITLRHDRIGDINMQILSADGEFLTTVERSETEILSGWIDGPTEGFVLINNPDRRGSNYSLQLTEDEQPCQADRFENNNSAAAAERISGGTHDALTFCGDVDYYRFSANESSHIEARLIGASELTLELLDDSGDRVLRSGGADEGGRSLVFNTQDAGIFFLRVQGPEGFTGDYELILEREVDGNNTCEQAETITLRENETVEVEGSTRDMDNNFRVSCGQREGDRDSAADAVYTLVVPANGLLTLVMNSRSEGFDPVLSLRSACDDAAAEIACNDDQGRDQDGERTDSRLEQQIEAGTYTIIADGWGTSRGEFQLSASLVVEEPEVGPACGTAQAIDVPNEGRISLPVNNENALRQYAPRTCADRSGDQGREIAFTFNVGERRIFSASTGFSDNGRSYDTVLYLLRGCGGLDEIACHDDIDRNNKLSRLTDVDLAPGQYTIIADAFYERDVGSVNLTLEFAAP
jgi:hypothetical protein